MTSQKQIANQHRKMAVDKLNKRACLNIHKLLINIQKGEITMDERKFIKKCKELVRNYYNNRVQSTDKNGKITTDDVFVVWFCKTLQNSKALVSTNVSDGMYYEITYNGDKNECYLDAYKKWQNVLIEIW